MWQFDNLRELLIPLPITIHFSLFNKIRIPKTTASRTFRQAQ